MCRLALFNHKWLQLVTIEELRELFVTLNAKNGGHGIGIALCYEKAAPIVYKGVSTEPYELAELAYGEKDNPDLRYVIYHARFASCAQITDDLCHPFTEGTTFGITMAHNGVVRSLSDSFTHSDTAIVFGLISKYGLPLKFLEDVSGVWIGVHKKVPFVVKSNVYSDLELAYTPDYEAWCFASRFYQMNAIFRKRFIMECELDQFTWTKKLDASAINRMKKPVREWHYPKSTYTPPKPISTSNKSSYPYTSGITTKYIAGYGDVKRRMIANRETWHEINCSDWYCEGECVGIVE